MTTTHTAAEEFLFQADGRIHQLRDQMATICAALSAKSLDERHVTGIYRLADDTLDEICAMETDFKAAWAAAFSSNPS